MTTDLVVDVTYECDPSHPRSKIRSPLPAPPDNPGFTGFKDRYPPTFAWLSPRKIKYNREGIHTIVDVMLEMSNDEDYRWGYNPITHYEALYEAVEGYVFNTLANIYKDQNSNKSHLEREQERLANSSDTRRHRVRPHSHSPLHPLG